MFFYPRVAKCSAESFSKTNNGNSLSCLIVIVYVCLQLLGYRRNCGTTHSVLSYRNKMTGMPRRYIAVQLPSMEQDAVSTSLPLLLGGEVGSSI